MKYLTAFFAVFVAALLLGCGGQQPATTAPATTPASTTPAAMPNVPSSEGMPSVPTGSPQATNSPAPAAQGGSFASITANAATLEYKAEYKTTSVSEGQTTIYESIMFLKGTTKMRNDMISAGTKTSLYLLDSKAYMCTFQAQTMCLTTDVPVSDVNQMVEDSPSDYTIVPAAPRTVAGMVGACFIMSGSKIDGSYETCYSSEGVPLYMASSDGKFKQEATKVQIGNIPNSDFTLPAEPVDISAYMGQYTT